MSREQRVCESLVEHFPVLARKRGYKPEICILATRSGLEVLRHFGVLARAVPVSVMACNAAAWPEFNAALMANRPPLWTNDMWTVGVGQGPTGGKGWDGHLIIETKGWVLDLSSGQMSRPARNMPIDEAIMTPVHPHWSESRVMVLENPDTGVVLVYQHRPDLIQYKDFRDWKRLDRGFIGALIELVGRDLDE